MAGSYTANSSADSYAFSSPGVQADIDAAIAANYERTGQITTDTVAQSLDVYDQLSTAFTNAFNQASEALAPGILDRIQEAASRSYDRAEELASRFQSEIMPDLAASVAETSRTMMANVQSMVNGEIPDDVRAKILRQAAEFQAGAGIFGEAGGNLVARDLGLTSLDMMNQGHQLAAGAATYAPAAFAAMNATLQAPVEAQIRTNEMLAPWRPPTLDPGGVFSGLLSANMRAGAQSADGIASSMRSYAMEANRLASSDRQFDAELALRTDALDLQRDEFNARESWAERNAALQRRAMDMMGESSEAASPVASRFAGTSPNRLRLVSRLSTTGNYNHDWIANPAYDA